MMLDDLSRRLKTAVVRGQYDGWTRMYTGRRTDTGVTLAGAGAGRVWVRAEEDSREETQVWGNASRINIPVWVGSNIAGELEIKTLEQTEAAFTAGAGAAASILPPILPEIHDQILIGGRQFLPGRMGLSALGGLYVYVEPFHYDGGYWPGGDFELTPPATADTKAWVGVALNPATGALVQVTGTEYALPVPMTETELGALAVPAGHIPVGAVVLQNGATALSGQERYADWHYHFAQAGGDIAGFVMTAPDSDTRNVVQPAGDHPAIVLKNNASQTDAPLQVQTSAGAVMVQVSAAGGLTVNEQGADADTRIEGDTDANLLFVDAGADRVGIGTNAPAAKLDVNGAAVIQTLLTDASTELTIASGAITAAQTFHRVDTEADAASDNLDTINGGAAGQLLLIRAENTGRTVVLRHNTGNILLFGAADVDLDETYKLVLLAYDGDQSKWVQVGGSGGGGGSVTVEDADGSPSYGNVTKLIFDEGTVTQPAANQARVTFPATAGSLVTTTQALATQVELYDNTLGANGSWDVQNSDLVSGVGNFADYDYLKIYLFGVRATNAATAKAGYLLFGTGGGALDTTATNYGYEYASAANTTAAAARGDLPYGFFMPAANSPAGYYSDVEITVYAPGGGTNKAITAVSAFRRDATNHDVRTVSTMWENTGTITRIGIRTDNHATDLIASGGRMVIYGVKTQNIITAVQGALTQATVQTANNTATTLASVTVNEDDAVTVVATITGAIADYSAAIGGTVTAVARRAAGGNVTLVGSVTTNVQEDSGGSPTFSADVDTGTQTLRLRVTGITSETWNWRTTYEVLRENT